MKYYDKHTSNVIIYEKYNRQLSMRNIINSNDFNSLL